MSASAAAKAVLCSPLVLIKYIFLKKKKQSLQQRWGKRARTAQAQCPVPPAGGGFQPSDGGCRPQPQQKLTPQQGLGMGAHRRFGFWALRASAPSRQGCRSCQPRTAFLSLPLPLGNLSKTFFRASFRQCRNPNCSSIPRPRGAAKRRC